MISSSQFTDRQIRIPGMSQEVVLVVDDEPEILAAFAALLERRLGLVTVLCASSAEEAMEVLSRERVDVVVTDYQMPGQDGVGFLAQVREAKPAVVRVLMTAHSHERIAIQNMVDASPDLFLSKPFKPGEAVAAVQAALKRRRT